jgi:2-oxoglutarate dehydrogenase E2 component (dihydrolipoamide succinyltransferase)
VVSEAEEAPPSDASTSEERLRTRSTPVVRKIAEEHGIDIEAVSGSGHAGRVTKQDILSYIEGGAPAPAAPSGAQPAASPAPAAPQPSAPPSMRAPSDLWTTFYREVQHPEFPVRAADRVEPMGKIRRLTAEHMVLAKRVAPHVHSFIEIDFSAIDRIRTESKDRWAAQGAKVSYTAFVAWAVSRVLRDFPMVNSTISCNNVIYRGNVNIGLAVDLDPGLIVPVVHDADHLGLVGIGNKIVDLATRARERKLVPAEIQGATFTITNPGVLGTLVGMPVIPKGTSAILGTGAIEKRVVVVTDAETGTDTIAIRKRSLFSLGYDHRIVDGADSARYLASLKETLESFPSDA